jgi:hypothetical protein
MTKLGFSKLEIMKEAVWRCIHCGMTEAHQVGQHKCYICTQWISLTYRHKKVTLTEQDFRTLMYEATVCPDTGYVWQGGEDGPFRKSLDRIDNQRGYEADNLRVVCAYANLTRRRLFLNLWSARCARARARASQLAEQMLANPEVARRMQICDDAVLQSQ